MLTQPSFCVQREATTRKENACGCIKSAHTILHQTKTVIRSRLISRIFMRGKKHIFIYQDIISFSLTPSSAANFVNTLRRTFMQSRACRRPWGRRRRKDLAAFTVLSCKRFYLSLQKQVQGAEVHVSAEETGVG